jgi:hypothetical protein
MRTARPLRVITCAEPRIACAEPRIACAEPRNPGAARTALLAGRTKGRLS